MEAASPYKLVTSGYTAYTAYTAYTVIYNQIVTWTAFAILAMFDN